jgi:hypothetical protein
MFNKNGTPGAQGNYTHISLDEFSDDDSERGDTLNSNKGAGDGGGGGASLPQHTAQELMQRQDQGLEMLSQSADRLGKMSTAIGEELGFQNQMLDEMDQDLEEAADNMDFVTRKTKEFIEKSG